jgi:hypothetical protein
MEQIKNNLKERITKRSGLSCSADCPTKKKGKATDGSNEVAFPLMDHQTPGPLSQKRAAPIDELCGSGCVAMAMPNTLQPGILFKTPKKRMDSPAATLGHKLPGNNKP